jgi:zinc protease
MAGTTMGRAGALGTILAGSAVLLGGCSLGMSSGTSDDGTRSVTVGPTGEVETRAEPRFDRSIPPEVGRPRSVSLPDVDEFTLENGLTVAVVEKDDLPVVSLRLQFRGGARVLTPGQAGLSTLVAEMLSEGTADRSANEFAEAVEALGASFGSTGGIDVNTIRMDLLASQLGDGLGLLAEATLRPAFPEEALERVKAERLARILQSRDDPSTLANEAFAKVLYGEEHPYGQPLLGTEETVSAIDRDAVMGYYRARYEPGSALLVVAGDVDSYELRGRLEELFETWEGMAGITPAFEIPEATPETTIYIVDKPGAAQSEIRMGRVAIDYAEPDFLTLNVMNTVLGGSFTSRLNTRIREEKGYSYGAGSSFQRRQLPGPFLARSAVYTPVTDSSVVEFVRELGRLGTEDVPEGELDQARNYVAFRLPQRFQTASDLAARVGEIYLYDLSPDYYDDFVDETLAVDADAVRDAARRWLDLSRMVIVVAGDRELIEDPLRALGIGPVIVLEGPAPASEEDR